MFIESVGLKGGSGVTPPMEALVKGVALSHSCVTCCRMQGFWPARYCRPNSASVKHTICRLRRTLGSLNLLACLRAQAQSIHKNSLGADIQNS